MWKRFFADFYCCMDKNAIEEEDEKLGVLKTEESGIKKNKIIIHYNKNIDFEHEFNLLQDFFMNSFMNHKEKEKEKEKEKDDKNHLIPEMSFLKYFQPKYIIHGYLMKYIDWQKSKWRDSYLYPYSMYGFLTTLLGFLIYGCYESYPYSIYILLFGSFVTFVSYEILDKKMTSC